MHRVKRRKSLRADYNNLLEEGRCCRKVIIEVRLLILLSEVPVLLHVRNARAGLFALSLISFVAAPSVHGSPAAAAFLQGGRDPFGHEKPTQPEIDMAKKRLKALKKEQYQSLKKDTDQLLVLATELKESVDKTTENTLSLEVIKKTEEVEKLAKKVREKMKGY